MASLIRHAGIVPYVNPDEATVDTALSRQRLVVVEGDPIWDVTEDTARRPRNYEELEFAKIAAWAMQRENGRRYVKVPPSSALVVASLNVGPYLLRRSARIVLQVRPLTEDFWTVHVVKNRDGLTDVSARFRVVGEPRSAWERLLDEPFV
jgi:hypothetical protein